MPRVYLTRQGPNPRIVSRTRKRLSPVAERMQSGGDSYTVFLALRRDRAPLLVAATTGSGNVSAACERGFIFSPPGT
jgi:hypothetical protein